MQSATMRSTDAYYNHSGKFNPAGLVMMLSAALVVGPLLGVVYGFIVAVNPLVYVNFLATLFGGALTGMAVGKLAKPGRVRSLGVCAFAGAVAGLGFQYTQWWATLQFYDADVALTQPLLMWTLIGELAEAGPWSLMGIELGSTGFAILWCIEGLILIAAPTLLAMAEGSTPYCERCDSWAVDAEPLGPFDYVSDVDTLKARIDRRDHEPLKAFGRPEVTDERYSTITLAACTGCKGLMLATVTNVEVEVEKDGDTKLDKTDVLSHILLDAPTFDALAKL